MDEDNCADVPDYDMEDDGPQEEVEKRVVRWQVVQHAENPSPRPRHGHRAIAIKDLIIIFGGGNEGMIEELHCFHTQKKQWLAPQVRGEIPSPAAAFGAAALGAKIYTFGGMIEYGKYTNDVYELTTTRWEWRRMNTKTIGNELPPAPRLGHSFVISEKNQKAYVFGGLCNDLNDNRRNLPRYMNDFHVLNLANAPNTVTWEKPETHGTPPKARESHTAVIYENDKVSRMVVYGGMDGVRLGDLWYLDLNTYEWQEIKFDDPRTGIPPVPRSLHSAVLINDKMFVFGGWVPMLHLSNSDSSTQKEWKCTDTLGCWDITKNCWVPLCQYNTEEGSGPRGRSGHCAAVVGNRMYIWSGRDGYRKAWSNQVCCRDLWILETLVPEQPTKIQLSRAGFNQLEVSWPPVMGANGYFLQIGPGDAKDVASPEKRSSPLKQSVQSQKEEEKASKQPPGTTPSLISTQGTTYTAPAASKPTADEGGLPQDLFEDSEKNETTSPKVSGDAGTASEEKKPTISENTSEEAVKKEEEETVAKKKQEEEDENLQWFDIGVIKDSSIVISAYFNDKQQSLDKQLNDLIEHNAFKCVNDPVYTDADKVILVNGQSYRFRVCAINGLGKGPWSEIASFKTCIPGFPSAPSSIRITKSQDGAQLTWEPPANVHVSGKIIEYSVYLAVKNQSASSADSQLAFMRVYCGPQAECQVPQANLGTAYVDQTNKPAIIFRIAARNEKGYGPATQVRWLQDQQKMPIPVRNPYPNVAAGGYLYQHAPPPPPKRRFDPH
ncbi:CBN-HCF-1 protein [Caenorhabditis brenneri]|uniref:CBN-HCF-1 protein n=1 Tax=Caenorhabditis brenneri TaxID=135651 RepID=G0NG88_CAEBE|nr:CBN-HCF-1 protein [Caenorhabditis brenneri]